MKRWAWTGLLVVLLGAGGFGCDANSMDKPKVPPRTYANPISLEGEWGEYGLGDPFVFKHNGYFYLYVSTRDTDAGVKVWRSDNLVDWIYVGLCAEDPITTGAYAPEVRYWNGKFYMYTSPAGQGHYVLVADQPTGPFEVATDNFGRTIDGSTFVDDDGKWYFYYAGAMGIQAAPMADPLTVKPEETQTGAYMGGWTEGPSLFKRGGKYYMTYTGNHVFNAGYRVDVAVSDDPLRGFEGQANNPVLLRTEGDTVGLGHNSIVTGPDLDTQYIVYHNLEGHGIVGPLRHMNIDRIVWYGDLLRVAGPTSDPQPVPEMPVFSDRFDRDAIGQAWKSKGKAAWSATPEQGLMADGTGASGLSMLLAGEKTGRSYTAEFHVQHQSGENGRSGIVFSYKDRENFGTVTWNAAIREIEAQLVRDGKPVDLGDAITRVPDNLDIGQLQSLRLEVNGKTVRIYAEGMRLLTLILPSEAGEGQIGYAIEGAKARFGYVAFSNFVDGSGATAAYMPLPGRVDARDAHEYLVNVAKSGDYSLRFRLKTGATGAKFRLMDGDAVVAEGIEAKPDSSGAWRTVAVNGVKLTEGMRQLTLKVQQGEMDLAWFDASPYAPVTARAEDFNEKMIPGWTRYEGEWSVKDGMLRSSSMENGKIATGEDGWTDYEVQADMSIPEPGGQSGVAVRVTEPANGMELNQNRDEFLRGYYVYIDERGIHLVKHHYNTVPLADATLTLPSAEDAVHLAIRAIGSRITVYVNDIADPVIDYEDDGEQAFLNGRVALKTVGTSARFDRVFIAPIQ